VVGLSKFDGKERRRQRKLIAQRQAERDRMLRDLGSPKYRQRVKERKLIEDEHGNKHFRERYYDEMGEE